MTGVVIIDKPEGWTSHDVVAKLRVALGERRIGHGGTLDPIATGVLPIFVGRATRAVEFSMASEKEYVAGIRLGMRTDTQDITGAVLSRNEHDVDDGALREALSRFTGDIMQIPPMYSAVKIGGKRMYELARRGIEADRPPRPITIHRLELVGVVGEDYILRVTCSKGTYVRTLCADIGDFLGCGAVMSSLRRTRVGAFGILTARELDAVVSAGERGEAEDMLFPVDSLFESFPAAVANPVCEHRCKSGAHYPCPDLPDGRYRVYSQSGEFLMLGDAKSGRMNIGKTFFNLRSRNND